MEIEIAWKDEEKKKKKRYGEKCLKIARNTGKEKKCIDREEETRVWGTDTILTCGKELVDYIVAISILT